MITTEEQYQTVIKRIDDLRSKSVWSLDDWIVYIDLIQDLMDYACPNKPHKHN